MGGGWNTRHCVRKCIELRTHAKAMAPVAIAVVESRKNRVFLGLRLQPRQFQANLQDDFSLRPVERVVVTNQDQLLQSLV